jgi:hypothetical protein
MYRRGDRWKSEELRSKRFLTTTMSSSGKLRVSLVRSMLRLLVSLRRIGVSGWVD